MTESEGDGGLDGGGLDGGGLDGGGADDGGAELSNGGGRATPDRPAAGSRMPIPMAGGGLLFAGSTRAGLGVLDSWPAGVDLSPGEASAWGPPA